MRACSRCASDSMQIALWLSWEAKVEDCFDSRDVNSTSYKVSSQKIVDFTALELFNVLKALFLRQIAMDFCGFEAKEGKESMQASTLFLFVEENNDTLFEGL